MRTENNDLQNHTYGNSITSLLVRLHWIWMLLNLIIPCFETKGQHAKVFMVKTPSLQKRSTKNWKLKGMKRSTKNWKLKGMKRHARIANRVSFERVYEESVREGVGSEVWSRYIEVVWFILRKKQS